MWSEYCFIRCTILRIQAFRSRGGEYDDHIKINRFGDSLCSRCPWFGVQVANHGF